MNSRRLPPRDPALSLGDSHVYLSTGCLHGEHHYCANIGGVAGPKEPACCKFCQAPCVCNCHQQEAE